VPTSRKLDRRHRDDSDAKDDYKDAQCALLRVSIQASGDATIVNAVYLLLMVNS